MDDMPETTLRSRAKNTNLGSPLRSSAKARTMSVTNLPLQELLDEVVVTADAARAPGKLGLGLICHCGSS